MADELQLKIITELIRTALECPVCLQLACRIRCCCSNGHTVCDRCFRRLLQLPQQVEPLCPICRSPISATRTTAAIELAVRNIVDRIKTTCGFRSVGCRELVTIPNVNEHEATCQYAPDAKCFVSRCQWSGMYTQIYDHVRSAHPRSVVSVKRNRWIISDVRTMLIGHQRKAFLLKEERGNMMWAILSRARRRTVRVCMMMVKTSAQQSTIAPTGMSYQLKAGAFSAYPFSGRRRAMMWDRNVTEALMSASSLFVRLGPTYSELTLSWKCR